MLRSQLTRPVAAQSVIMQEYPDYDPVVMLDCNVHNLNIKINTGQKCYSNWIAIYYYIY